ncbi:MAG: hypothetical protein EOO17_01300 [Chloroflexi bacterium]|nr:MAG: hypothetical protein EOO17_01300 [Chloroflexota bacterium]
METVRQLHTKNGSTDIDGYDLGDEQMQLMRSYRPEMIFQSRETAILNEDLRQSGVHCVALVCMIDGARICVTERAVLTNDCYAVDIDTRKAFLVRGLMVVRSNQPVDASFNKVA